MEGPFIGKVKMGIWRNVTSQMDILNVHLVQLVLIHEEVQFIGSLRE